jgi:hypothetical protein
MRDTIQTSTTQTATTLPIVELVSFRLTDGITPEAFLARAETTQALVSSKAGFLRRALLCDETGVWTDMVEWQSHAAALQAAETLMQNAEFLDFCSAIDTESVKMQHLPMLWRKLG